MARRASQAPQVQTQAHQQLKEAGSQVSRGLAFRSPSEDLDSRPHRETSGQILEEPTLPPFPRGEDSAFLSFGLLIPFGPSALGRNSQLFLIYGARFPPKQKLGVSKGKGGLRANSTGNNPK